MEDFSLLSPTNYSIASNLWKRLENAFQTAISFLYKKKSYKAEDLSNEHYSELIDATNEILSNGMNFGLREIPLSDITRNYLSSNIFNFSGFKTHAQLKKISSLLLDDNGKIKPFEKFKQEVLKYDKRYNKTYLNAEYNFAVRSAQAAGKWNNFLQDGDEFYLQYRTARDERVREEHRILDRITLPISSDFWKEYFPPNGWNCRCNVVQVNKDRYEPTNESEAIARGRSATYKPNADGVNKVGVFRFNPGIENKIFPPKAPYYKTKTKKEKDVIDRMLDQKQTNKAIQANNKILSERYNLPLGKPMSYKEANEGKENPKFKKKKEDGYHTNCTLCTVTHLLRRRGFNVEASPNLPSENNTSGALYDFYKKKKMNWEERFLKKDGTSPTYISSNKWSKKRGIKKMTDKHLVSFLNETLSNDGLYEIAVAWKKRGEHVFCVEVVNGEKRYFDPQNGKSDVSNYLKEIEPCYTYILRIDDKIINPKIGSLFLPIK